MNTLSLSFKLLDYIQENGGVTSTINGAIPKIGFAVSEYKDLELITSILTPNIINKYILDNINLLNTGYCFGAWYNSDDGQYYLDIIRVHHSKEIAILKGMQASQLAIYNIATGQEIRLAK